MSLVSNAQTFIFSNGIMNLYGDLAQINQFIAKVLAFSSNVVSVLFIATGNGTVPYLMYKNFIPLYVKSYDILNQVDPELIADYISCVNGTNPDVESCNPGRIAFNAIPDYATILNDTSNAADLVVFAVDLMTEPMDLNVLLPQLQSLTNKVLIVILNRQNPDNSFITTFIQLASAYFTLMDAKPIPPKYQLLAFRV